MSSDPINECERFRRLMSYESFDRPPVWYFGTWSETCARWLAEGLGKVEEIPEATGMDPDWENGIWNIHGLVTPGAIGAYEESVLEEAEDYRIVRTSLGGINRVSKLGSSIPDQLEPALKPTRESWTEFKAFLDPSHAERRPADWEGRADALQRRDGFKAFLGGSLFGWPRDWLGVEAISMLSYDDPALYEEIIDTIAEHCMAVTGPVLDRVQFDLAYFFEDCCFNNGPLFSPATYDTFYAKYYRKLVDFYHGKGVRFVLLDSDGKTDDLIPHWLDSGIDILFPIEVGTWQADPVELRRRFGRDLRMMGGFDKHLIPKGTAAVRRELERLKPLVESGGFVPLPDHRIPPDCSLQAFKDYVNTFKDVLCDGTAVAT